MKHIGVLASASGISSAKTSKPSSAPARKPQASAEAVTYLFARLRANWGTAFTHRWESVGDEAAQAREFKLVRAEYAEVIAGCDRAFVDEVVTRAKAAFERFAPHPPELRVIVEAVRDDLRRREAFEADERRKALPAPKRDPEKAWQARAFMRAFVATRGNIGRKGDVEQDV